jgi:hypothetical protein
LRLIPIQNHKSIKPGFCDEDEKKTDPFKTCILQPMWNANFIGPSRLQDAGFERIRFLLVLNAKSGFNALMILNWN